MPEVNVNANTTAPAGEPNGYSNWTNYTGQYTDVTQEDIVRRLADASEEQFWNPPPGGLGAPQGLEYWTGTTTYGTLPAQPTPLWQQVHQLENRAEIAEHKIGQIRALIIANAERGVFGQRIQDQLNRNEQDAERMLIELLEFFTTDGRIEDPVHAEPTNPMDGIEWYAGRPVTQENPIDQAVTNQ